MKSVLQGKCALSESVNRRNKKELWRWRECIS